MSQDTHIEWADSTLNLQMGCDGCELWNEKVRTCYAGVLTQKYAGKPGWPITFEQPKVFPERLDKALRWPDLRGTTRPEKPWFKNWPRVTFLNDMGDTFTRHLALDWLKPFIPRMEAAPVVWLILTKRAARMRAFFNDSLGYVPHNFALGVSITTPNTFARLRLLRETGGPKTIRWLSVEPVLADLSGMDLTGIDAALVGGESGNQARPMRAEWMDGIFQATRKSGSAYFLKQWGVDSANPNPRDPTMQSKGGQSKGGAWYHGHEWREYFDYRKSWDPTRIGAPSSLRNPAKVEPKQGSLF
jgi:protein gp37